MRLSISSSCLPSPSPVPDSFICLQEEVTFVHCVPVIFNSNGALTLLYRYGYYVTQHKRKDKLGFEAWIKSLFMILIIKASTDYHSSMRKQGNCEVIKICHTLIARLSRQPHAKPCITAQVYDLSIISTNHQSQSHTTVN